MHCQTKDSSCSGLASFLCSLNFTGRTSTSKTLHLNVDEVLADGGEVDPGEMAEGDALHVEEEDHASGRASGLEVRVDHHEQQLDGVIQVELGGLGDVESGEQHVVLALSGLW